METELELDPALQRKLKRAAAWTKKRNEEFKKLTKAQQRVAIAKDVIAQLKAKRLVSCPGTYVGSNIFREDIDGDTQLCNVLRAADNCAVCGIGALFVSAVEFADKLTLDESWGGSVGQSDIHDYLKPWFSYDQLVCIEHAFERLGADVCEEDLQRAGAFGDLFPNSTKRMIAIMENIIENNGRFKPPKLTKAQRKEYGLEDR